MHGRDLSDALRPGPVREQMRHRVLGPPARLIEVETVFFETGQVDDATVGTPRRVVRRGPTEIIPAGPHKLARHVRVPVERAKHLVGCGTEIHGVELVSADLMAL